MQGQFGPGPEAAANHPEKETPQTGTMTAEEAREILGEYLWDYDIPELVETLADKYEEKTRRRPTKNWINGMMGWDKSDLVPEVLDAYSDEECIAAVAQQDAEEG
jgi:hypothetical protein